MQYVEVEGEKLEFYSMVLFQRLVFAGMSAWSPIDVNTLFSYEMYSYPTALFDDKILLRKATAKAQLATIIIGKTPESVVHGDLHTYAVYDVDGGSLLWKVGWKECETFGGLCESYVDFVKTKYNPATLCEMCRFNTLSASWSV